MTCGAAWPSAVETERPLLVSSVVSYGATRLLGWSTFTLVVTATLADARDVRRCIGCATVLAAAAAAAKVSLGPGVAEPGPGRASVVGVPRTIRLCWPTHDAENCWSMRSGVPSTSHAPPSPSQIYQSAPSIERISGGKSDARARAIPSTPASQTPPPCLLRRTPSVGMPICESSSKSWIGHWGPAAVLQGVVGAEDRPEPPVRGAAAPCCRC